MDSLQPRLWTDEAALARIRQGLTREPLARLVQVAEELTGTSLPEGPIDDPEVRNPVARMIHAHALLALHDGDDSHGAPLLDAARRLHGLSIKSDLAQAFCSMQIAIAWDFGRFAWSEAERAEVAGILQERAWASDDVHDGNPDNPFNNWWGVTHASAGLCALAVHDYFDDMPGRICRQVERIRTYLLNYGDRGYYYEGTGYGNYAMSHWGPFVLAARNVAKLDPADISPGIARMPATTCALTVAHRRRPDSTEDEPANDIGMRLFWNDDGGQSAGPGFLGLYFALAEEGDRRALRWMFDHFCGESGDRSWLRPELLSLWVPLFYPWDQLAAEPAGTFPRTLIDNRTGLMIFRQRFQDADDAVLGLYAKSYHGGGHWHDDAGSWRFAALGTMWATCGGQAKPQPWFQGCLLKDGTKGPGGKARGLGKVWYFAPREDGAGSASVRLNNAYEVPRVDRHFAVDYSGSGGAPVVLAIYDRIWDQEESEWAWTMCFSRHLEFEAAPEINGFRLHDPDTHATLQASFGSPRNATVQAHVGEATTRTFSGGGVRHYPGARYVTVLSAGERINFFCVLTVQRGEAPEVNFTGEDLDLAAKVGDLHIALDHLRWSEGPLRITPSQT